MPVNPVYVRVILAEELNPQYVDNNIRLYQNGNEVAFAYATPYDAYFIFSAGDTISAVCNADVSPTGGANPFKVLQILENDLDITQSVNGFGKLTWVYQDTSPGNSFTFPGLVARRGVSYTFLASSTSNGNNWYFMNLFNEIRDYFPTGPDNNYTIDEIYINGYTTVYPNLSPGKAMTIPNPNGSIIPAGTTVNIHLSTPDPNEVANIYLLSDYQLDGANAGVERVYGTGWYSLVLDRDVDTSQGGINIQLVALN